MTAWSNLPNAKHIDAVIASANANPDKWAEAWENAGGWSEARDAARSAARSAAWDVTWNTTRSAAWDAAYDAARNAIAALVAYDDCAHLLSANPEHVKMLAGIGNEAAILLHPASLVFSEIKNESLV